jgi:hypothetical protein
MSSFTDVPIVRALADAATFFDKMQQKDRERARQVLHTAPGDLTDYQKGLLVDDVEYLAYRRSLEADARQRADDERRLPELRSVLVPDEASPAVIALAEHAVELCIEHRIHAVLNRRQGVAGYANASQRAIAVRPIISERSYATALHEIGHVVDGKHPSGFTKSIAGHSYSEHPMRELAAWRWACRNAARWTRKMHEGLSSRLTREADVYRKQSDGEGLMDSFTICIRESASRICDQPLTFTEVDKACAVVETGPASTTTADVPDLSAALATRVKELLTNGA